MQLRWRQLPTYWMMGAARRESVAPERPGAGMWCDGIQSRADPRSKPGHGQIRDHKVKRSEPRGRRDRNACGDTTAEECQTNCVRKLRLVTRCDHVRNLRTDECANRLRGERHYEVPRLEQLHGSPDAFGVAYIRAGGRRDYQGAYEYKRLVDRSADGNPSNNGKNVSKKPWHVAILLRRLELQFACTRLS